MEGIPSNEFLTREVEKAHTRIKKHVRRTALENSAYFTEKTGVNVFLKLESEQLTGSFKARGAFNKALIIAENPDPETANKKLFTASSGNHGLGLTLALRAIGKKAIVYVPVNVAKSKEENLLRHQAIIRKFGDCMETEKGAIEASKEENGIYISPYNDPDIIAGQGTIAFEILEDVKDMDAIFVTVGGGGMISGISSYAKHVNPNIKIIGCSPANANTMEQCVRGGKQIEIVNKKTLSEGSAGNPVIPSITFPICQRNVDRWINVSEQEISDAMFLMLDVHHKVVEGSAGVALAAFLKVKDELQGQKIAVILCGGNVDTGILKQVIDSHWKE